jgi:hypothetical protein
VAPDGFVAEVETRAVRLPSARSGASSRAPSLCLRTRIRRWSPTSRRGSAADETNRHYTRGLPATPPNRRWSRTPAGVTRQAQPRVAAPTQIGAGPEPPPEVLDRRSHESPPPTTRRWSPGSRRGSAGVQHESAGCRGRLAAAPQDLALVADARHGTRPRTTLSEARSPEQLRRPSTECRNSLSSRGLRPSPSFVQWSRGCVHRATVAEASDGGRALWIGCGTEGLSLRLRGNEGCGV